MRITVYVATCYPATQSDQQSPWTIGVFSRLGLAIAKTEEYYEYTFGDDRRLILMENEAIKHMSGLHPYIRRIEITESGQSSCYGGLFIDALVLDISDLEFLAMAEKDD